MTPTTRAFPAHISTDSAPLWINRALESLWLLTVVLVPLAFLGREYGEWSSVVGSYELPKIAFLRVATGLMAILWVLEWTLTSPSPTGIWSGASWWLLRPRTWPNKLYGWLAVRPVRWLFLAVGFYAFSVLISTVLSGALSVSLWGDVPGQDSYSAYTVASYIVLFAVVATHLKTPSQLWRLLGAISIMGALVGGYAILQHYGYDFLNLSEPVGNNIRVTSAMGGAIFAASILAMTVPVSWLAATMAIKGPITIPKTWGGIGVFALLIAVQLLGILFTLSRGPWGGMALALIALMILTAVFVGWRYAAKATLVLAVAAILTAVILVSPIPQKGAEETEKSSAVGEVSERLTSVASQVTSGGIAGRKEIWQRSWDLIVDRPWPGFDNLGFDFLRPLIGYGPDLYRYTYLLVSPEDPEGRPPQEAAHGHNIFVHQAVELGFFGLFAVLGVFLAPLLLAAYWLLRSGNELNILHKLVLAGLAAALVGRFLEQMVGLARVSDLALAWTILAIFAALPTINWGGSSDGPPRRAGMRPIPAQEVRPVSPHRSLARAARPRLLSSLFMVALIAAGVSGLIWFKNVNYVRAAFAADQGAERFRNGELTAALESLDRAIDLAPDVSSYYEERTNALSTYRRDVGASSSLRATGLFTELERLAEEEHARTALWVKERPLYVRARLARAASALVLSEFRPDSTLAKEASRLLDETVQLLPANTTLRNRIAGLYISLGQPDAALPHLTVAKLASDKSENLFLGLVNEGVAYRQLGDFENSVRALNEAIALRPKDHEAYYERGATHNAAGELTLAIADLGESIRLQPEQARAYQLRGTAYHNLGRFNHAVSDLDQAISLSPGLAPVYNNRGLAYAGLGRLERALEDFDSAIRLDSRLAVAYNNRGFVLRDLGRPEEALEALTYAVSLDPEFQLAYYNRAIAYTLLGRETDAEADERRAVELGFDPDLLSRAIKELKTPR